MIKKLSMRESTQFDQEYFGGIEEEKGGNGVKDLDQPRKPSSSQHLMMRNNSSVGTNNEVVNEIRSYDSREKASQATTEEKTSVITSAQL